MTEQAVIQLGMYCEKCKKIAMRCVSKRIDGINKLNFDMSKMTLTIEGAVDAVSVVNELRKKFCHAQLLYKGPVPKPPSSAPTAPKPDDAKKPEEKLEAGKSKKKHVRKDPKGKDMEKPDGLPPVKMPTCAMAISYKPCCGPCGNPCSGTCSCDRRPGVLWPKHCPPPPPTDVWYVFNEENSASCTIC